MSVNEREQAREWFDKADTDLTSATLLAGIPGPPAHARTPAMRCPGQSTSVTSSVSGWRITEALSARNPASSKHVLQCFQCVQCFNDSMLPRNV